MTKRIILLNGPSSSGKSTLASTLQTIIKDEKDIEYGIISIDDFLEMTTDKEIFEDDVFEISSKLCEKAIDILNLKQGIIIDHVITSERIFTQLKNDLRSYDLYLIHVTCPLHELKRREEERNNRRIGSAEASYQYLFPKEGYHLIVDTFELSARESALKIFETLYLEDR